MPYGWGCMMFLKKKDFIPIPSEFFIYFGDEWIWQSHQKRNKPPKTLKNFNLVTRDHSSTCHVMRTPYYGVEFGLAPVLFPKYLSAI